MGTRMDVNNVFSHLIAMPEFKSTISNSAMTMMEGSDLNNSSNPYRPSKRLRQENSPSSLRFKGVVLQQNGRWGAQIYANHQRLWLGTFMSEKAAAMAYDSAAIKLRSGDSHRNFPWTNITIQEPSFQDHYTTEAILSMIKDGSYESKFTDYIRTRSSKAQMNDALIRPAGAFINQDGVLCQKLFQKVLTPSDVGKLNRLVIPKKHAIKYFPLPFNAGVKREESNGNVGGGDPVQLEFFDCNMRPWKFRYCRWKSSHSYVFAKGWNRFVDDKALKANDVVLFYRCEYREGLKEKKSFYMIDVGYNGVGGNVGSGGVGGKVELELGYGGCFGCRLDGEGKKIKEEEELVEMGIEKKSFRLFGVDIIYID